MYNKEHNAHCESIAKELTKIANGDYITFDGGDWYEPELDDNGVEYAVDSSEPKTYYTEQGTELITINGETIETTEVCFYPVSMWDYFDDFLDIDYICNYQKEYKACRIMIAWGGPNIYVNTWDAQVELYWWNESGNAYLTRDVCDQIDEFAEELFNCID